ncbi:MAG: hypothetical protein J1G01_03740 [Clostridiales bacterium]|nr:hypothetical protein [Clostridiales bacterium]
MAKNKNKARNNNRSQPQPQPKPQPSLVIKPAEELSSEEREELRAKGEEERAQLIKEGESEKARLIQEGEDEKEKIIKRAEKEAQKSVDEVQRQYIEEIREEAIEEAEEEKERILAEATAIREEVETKQEELESKLGDLDKQYEDLAIKIEQYTKDLAELESKKRSYKVDALQEVAEQIGAFNATIVLLEEEKNNLEKKLKCKEQELAACNDDKELYLSELGKSDVRRQKLMELEHQIILLKANNDTLDKLYKGCLAENTKYKTQILSFGDNPTGLLAERNQLEEQNQLLQDRLANVPGADEIKRLRKVDEAYEKVIAELARLKTEKIESDKKLAELDIYSNDLENSRRFIRVLELQRLELQRELDRIQENYNNRQDRVFASLSAIDDEEIVGNYSRTGRTLWQICEDFRNYLASRTNNPLYYSRESIRTFFAGLAASRIIILQGMSGTGKSSLPKAFEDYMKSVTERIEVQSSWKDRNDLLGFYNDFEKRYKETKFLEALYRATRDSNNIHLIMLDEMNLSRIEYYFADFLSVLEEEKQEKWKISLVSRDVRGVMPEYIVDGELRIGENTWFIGTANKDDSTFTITDKVYDRAIVLNFEERAEEFDGRYTEPRGVSYAELKVLLSDAVQLTPDIKNQIKHLVGWLDERMKTYFEISFGNRISKQINMFVPAYVKCGGNVEEAVDIIFSTKVLRKLQGMYDESTKNGLNEFLSELRKDNKGIKLQNTQSTIRKMIDRI